MIIAPGDLGGGARGVKTAAGEYGACVPSAPVPSSGALAPLPSPGLAMEGRAGEAHRAGGLRQAAGGDRGCCCLGWAW